MNAWIHSVGWRADIPPPGGWPGVGSGPSGRQVVSTCIRLSSRGLHPQLQRWAPAVRKDQPGRGPRSALCGFSGPPFERGHARVGAVPTYQQLRQLSGLLELRFVGLPRQFAKAER